MQSPEILRIGSYSDEDVIEFNESYGGGILSAGGSDPLSGIPEDARRLIRAIAFKGHAPFGGAEMDAFPNLGLIANYGVGYDLIDVEAASGRGVKVANTPDVLSDEVADLAVALLLAQSRQILKGSEWVRSGEWARSGELPLNRKVSGGRAGIVGLGRIGREIANRLAAFKMEIHYHSRNPKMAPPDWTWHSDPVGLAGAVDFLFVALVGGKATEGYVSAEAISALGPGGVIINISRGSTIDEAALLDALESGRIRGAGLDVFLNEPHIDPRFLALDNVVLQPHQGSGTFETRAAMAKLQRDNIDVFLAGRPLLTPVN